MFYGLLTQPSGEKTALSCMEGSFVPHTTAIIGMPSPPLPSSFKKYKILKMNITSSRPTWLISIFNVFQHKLESAIGFTLSVTQDVKRKEGGRKISDTHMCLFLGIFLKLS